MLMHSWYDECEILLGWGIEESLIIGKGIDRLIKLFTFN